MKTTNANFNASTTRRDFLKTSALIGGALMGPAILPGNAHAGGNDAPLKVGLIGCGGRGTGAASEALKADKNVALTAVGDVFPEKIKESLAALQHEVGRQSAGGRRPSFRRPRRLSESDRERTSMSCS